MRLQRQQEREYKTMSQFGFNIKTEHAIQSEIIFNNDFTHSVVYGSTGSGKTLGFVNNLIDTRIKNHYSLLFFDYKGKEGSVVKHIAKQYEQIDSVVEFGYPWSRSRINLLPYLSENSLRALIDSLIGGHHDPFWSKQGIDMVITIIEYFSVGHRLEKILESPLEREIAVNIGNTKLEEKTYTTYICFDTFNFEYIYTYFENKFKFHALLYGAKEILSIAKQKIALKQKNLDITKQKYISQVLKDFIKATQALKKFSSFNIKSTEASGDNGVYFMAKLPLGILAKNIYINAEKSESLDLMLNQHKIIIINCEAFTDEILSELLNTTLQRLSRRAKFELKQHVPVSVIIDEANRVISDKSDLHTDILRESKVEINVIGQNREQFFLKFGNQKWLSFEHNLSNKFIFDKSFSKTKNEPFFYKRFNSEKVYIALPYIVSTADKYKAERDFQLKNPFLKKYIEKEGIAIYDAIQYETNSTVGIYNQKGEQIKKILIPRTLKFKIGEVSQDEKTVVAKIF